jgi:acyl carrier protein
MNDTDRYQIVRSVLAQIAPEVDLESIEPDTDLHTDLDIDSMDFLNFVIGLHEASGVDIPERDYPLLATPGGCVDYLRAHATAG